DRKVGRLRHGRFRTRSAAHATHRIRAPHSEGIRIAGHAGSRPTLVVDLGLLAGLRSRHQDVGGAGASLPPSTSASAPERAGSSKCSLLETAIGFGSLTSALWLADHEGSTH